MRSCLIPRSHSTITRCHFEHSSTGEITKATFDGISQFSIGYGGSFETSTGTTQLLFQFAFNMSATEQSRFTAADIDLQFNCDQQIMSASVEDKTITGTEITSHTDVGSEYPKNIPRGHAIISGSSVGFSFLENPLMKDGLCPRYEVAIAISNVPDLTVIHIGIHAKALASDHRVWEVGRKKKYACISINFCGKKKIGGKRELGEKIEM